MKTHAVWLAIATCACAAAPPPMSLPADFPPTVREAIWSDAARRAGVGAERLQLTSAQAVTWRDGALGCPEPGRLYTQALLPGWRVELAAPGGVALLYHVSRRGGTWLWCPRERAQTPAPGDSTI